jgi:cytoskeleton protein RodZ
VFEIGNSLREARLRQALDFPEVEQATKIRGKYLRALEDEQFDTLPAQTYVKGFLRTYSEYLGLDGQLYVDEYNSRFVVDSEELLRLRRSTPQRTRRQRRLESNVVLLALLGIVIVTALVIAAWKFGGGDHQTLLPTVTGSTDTTAQPPPRNPVPSTKARLVLRAVRGSSALEVRRGSATGRQLFTGTLERGGEPQVFTATRLWIQVGSPEALRATLNYRTVRLRRGGPLIALVTRRGIKPAAR